MTTISAPTSEASLRRATLTSAAIIFLAFIILGIPDSMLGIANPFVRENFSIPAEAFSQLLFAGSAGYFIASFISGQLITRFGVQQTLILSAVLRAGGLLGYAVAPSWITLIGAGFLSGAGGGVIDSVINTYTARRHSPSVMFWLHASFGIGATIGPAIMTLMAVTLKLDWRIGYLGIATAQILIAAVYISTRSIWDIAPAETQVTEIKPKRVSLWQTLRLPVVWLSIITFILYTGTEVLLSVWGFSYFTEGRGISPEAAGAWVTLYWGTFTLGRVVGGFITRVMKPLLYLRLSMVFGIIGSVLLWWGGSDLINILGIVTLGFAVAPMFPILITNTVDRVGRDHEANAIGFQIAAASTGIAVLPAIVGWLAPTYSFAVLPIVLLVASIGLFVLHELMMHWANTRPINHGSSD